jgi:hypothetical protein
MRSAADRRSGGGGRVVSPVWCREFSGTEPASQPEQRKWKGVNTRGDGINMSLAGVAAWRQVSALVVSLRTAATGAGPGTPG